MKESDAAKSLKKRKESGTERTGAETLRKSEQLLNY